MNPNDTLTYFITNTSDIGLLEYVTGIINDINNLSGLKKEYDDSNKKKKNQNNKINKIIK